MLAFKPLFQRDFFSGAQAFQRPGMEKFRGPAERQAPTVNVNASVESTLARAYDRMQAAVQSRFPAVAEAGTASAPATDTQDYSPQAVADRIVGFIADRLAQEKAGGASQERLQELYQQALKGVEQGLREGRDIIQDQGLFSGDTKDTFYQTVNRVADGLEQLGEEMFGTDIEAPATTTPTVSSSFEASRSQVQIERSRSFEMEVVTQEGDRVKIMVNSGQSFASDQLRYQDANTSINSFEASFSSYDNLAFSVEGDLNESELAALNDLFSQVNNVAETFYGGNVEQAFNQAMDVGMDAEQLASFAVNINQSESVAVRETYVAVQNMAGPARENPYQNLFERLGKFAERVQQGADALLSRPGRPANMQSLYTDLIGRLPSDQGRGNGDAFQRFANRLVG